MAYLCAAFQYSLSISLSEDEERSKLVRVYGSTSSYSDTLYCFASRRVDRLTDPRVIYRISIQRLAR